jgi:hypothetical protein
LKRLGYERVLNLAGSTRTVYKAAID